MLNELNLPTLQQRRKEMRLTFLFKIAEGLVPAIPPDLYLTPMRQKRHIKPRVFTDCETTNIVNKYVTNNTRPFVIPQSSTNTYTAHTYHDLNTNCLVISCNKSDSDPEQYLKNMKRGLVIIGKHLYIKFRSLKTKKLCLRYAGFLSSYLSFKLTHMY